MTAAGVAAAGAAPPLQRIAAQARMEVVLTLRRGESVLLTFLIPVLVLVFFTLVDVLPTGTDDPVDFLVPGVLALAVMSTAMTGLAIATGFERSTGVLTRLAITPLSRRDLIAAKAVAVFAVEVLQIVAVLAVGVALGWRPDGGLAIVVVAVLVATIGFAGIGLLMAGTLPALTTLALANAVHVVLMFLGGVIVPIDDMPLVLRVVARALPVGALSDIAHASLGEASLPPTAWPVLIVWAVLAPALAARLFRWS